MQNIDKTLQTHKMDICKTTSNLLNAVQLLSNQEPVTQVLLYQVARGTRNSNAILGGSQIHTFQRGFLYQDGGVLTDANSRSAKFITTEIKASNGVIHVIDRVVLP